MNKNKIRGFEPARKSDGTFYDVSNQLPKRQTKNAAGYDFCAAEDVVIYPIWGVLAKYFHDKMFSMYQIFSNFSSTKEFFDVAPKFENVIKATFVNTGVKAYMQEDEVLHLFSRSGLSTKSGLVLSNGVGVIDADYYENKDNDGVIMFAFYNFSIFPVVIKKGDRIGQGVFSKFLKTDNDIEGKTRSGGFGSTNK